MLITVSRVALKQQLSAAILTSNLDRQAAEGTTSYNHAPIETTEYRRLTPQNHNFVTHY
ncbi:MULTISPECIES: hypothetical protein [Microcystis]|uniref:Uncharacterized protein n=2 Tax=Microcystis TaxID=1125 RepID=A0A0A1VR11_MICAE|nr:MULTISPECIES: hypothetical protein [Microcystis]MCZ8038679.1 hypothetical protein [Microcystis sp. LE17-20A]MCZ8214544.1 hypothetical protein [Microcystis sp. LE19-8.1F]MDT3675853.1 hypothetical protein [Microcystis wesenbergii NRERC-220]GAL91878.1 hypothetical protein N44_00166 [Microcystis aeruginosa NIES-44]